MLGSASFVSQNDRAVLEMQVNVGCQSQAHNVWKMYPPQNEQVKMAVKFFKKGVIPWVGLYLLAEGGLPPGKVECTLHCMQA